jgi:hypothetical protein
MVMKILVLIQVQLALQLALEFEPQHRLEEHSQEVLRVARGIRTVSVNRT